MMKKCFECGNNAVMEHHVVPRVLGGIRTVPLCDLCHGKVHNKDFLNISELTKKGLENAKKNGKILGRKPNSKDSKKRNTQGYLNRGFKQRKIKGTPRLFDEGDFK